MTSFVLVDILNEATPSPLQSQMFDIRPLSFDRVHAGHVTTSNFPAFKLPVELLPHITTYLSHQDFNALALVDHDCRRLASLSRFKDVRVNFASKSKPPEEQLERFQYHQRCVRRLNITLNPDMVKSQQNFPNHTIFVPSRDRDVSDASLACLDATFIHKAISTSFHNLITVDWDGPAFFSAPLFNSIKNTNIRNLHLRGIVMDPEITLSLDDCTVQLETLSLRVQFPPPNKPERVIQFFDNIFRLAASGLQRLTWKMNVSDDILYVDPTITFKKLLHLTLSMTSLDDSKFLHLFLGKDTQIRSLTIEAATSPARDFLRSRGNILSLKHLSWVNRDTTTHSSYADIHVFLLENPQLESLHVPHAIPQVIIDELLLPLLASTFPSLTSLHLVSDASTFPEASLRVIGSISTLHQLWLSAGNQGFRSTWEVDHKVVRDALSPLRQLRTVAFSHDTYITDAHPLAPRFCDYYAAKSLPEDLDISKYLAPSQLFVYRGTSHEYDLVVSHQLQMRRLAWEKWHAERMLDVARAYALVFPSLEWCFVGQLPVDKVDGKWGVLGEHPCLDREPCLFSLRRKMDMGLWRPL